MSRLLDAARRVLLAWDRGPAAVPEGFGTAMNTLGAVVKEAEVAGTDYARGFAAGCEKAAQVAEQSARQEWLRVSQRDADEIADVIRTLAPAPQPAAPGASALEDAAAETAGRIGYCLHAVSPEVARELGEAEQMLRAALAPGAPGTAGGAGAGE